MHSIALTVVSTPVWPQPKQLAVFGRSIPILNVRGNQNMFKRGV